MDKSSMFYWWPRVRIANLKIPMPKTVLVPCTDLKNVINIFDGKDSSEFNRLVWDVEMEASSLGYPVFVRTSHVSDKHRWRRTCYIEGVGEVRSHLHELLDFGFSVDVPFDGYVVREFLLLPWGFHAFDGMPIASERRLFFRDDELLCHHPYWPEKAIKNPDREDWRWVLKGLQKTPPNEISLLEGYAKRIVKAVGGGFWSVDFCRHHNRRWFFTDMAEGSQSWHWPKCSHAPKGEKG
jgi:hypothetical protein